MIIRKGNPEDMPAVLELIKELARFEHEPDAVVITSDDLVRDGFSNPPLFNTFVALSDDVIVGVALFYNRYSTWKGKTIHLEDLIVTESMRGKGIGMRLYSAVINFGKSENVRRIEWNVLDWNSPAIKFYKKTGAKVLDSWNVVQMDEEGMINFTSGLNLGL